jgi:hypothetical protein
MSTSKTNGSQTATLTTEHDLATITDAGRYFLKVDVNALADGEILTLRVYTKARTSDTERLADVFSIQAPVVSKVLITYVYGVDAHVRFTLRQDGGTGRAYPWQVNDA